MGQYKSIAETEDEIVDDFVLLGDDWSEKYNHIIMLGKTSPGLPENAYNEENKVRGCQSNVWLITHMQDGRIVFKGDSDALIVKGLVTLLTKVLSGHTPDEILDTPLTFIERIGLQNNLSPTRNNGLAAMIKQMKFYALAYKAKQKNTAQ